MNYYNLQLKLGDNREEDGPNDIRMAKINEDNQIEKNVEDMILDKKIESLGLSIRSFKALILMDIKTIRDLVNLSESDLLKRNNFGIKSLKEINEKLNSFGFRFGSVYENTELSQSQLINLRKQVSEVFFSVRTKKVLKKLNINTFSDLAKKNESYYTSKKNFGSKSLKEIRSQLDKMELRFGMQVSDEQLNDKNISFFNYFIREKYEQYLINFNSTVSKTDFLMALPEKIRCQIEYDYMKYVGFSKENFIYDAVPLAIKTIKFNELNILELNTDMTIEDMLSLGEIGRLKIDDFEKEDEKKFLNLVVNNSYSFIERKLIKSMKLIDHIVDFDQNLSYNEKTVFRGRNAFNSKHLTLDELGKILNFTREGVRQIEVKINKKLIETQLWDDIIAEEFSPILDEKGFLYLNSLGDWYSKIKNHEVLLHNIVSLSLQQNISKNYPITGIKTENGWCFFKINKKNVKQIIEYIKKIIKKNQPDFFLTIINSIQDELSQKFLPLKNEDLTYTLIKIAASNFLVASDVLFGEKNYRTTYINYILYFSNKPLHIEEITRNINKRFNYNWKFSKVTSAIRENYNKNNYFSLYQYGRGTYGLLKHFKDYDNYSHKMLDFFKDIIIKKKQCRIEDLYNLAKDKFSLPEQFEWYHAQIILKENLLFNIKNGRVYSGVLINENIKDIAYSYLIDNDGIMNAIQLFDKVNSKKPIKINDLKMLPMHYPNKFSTYSKDNICLFSYLKMEININDIADSIIDLFGIMYKIEFSLLSQNLIILYPAINEQIIRSIIRVNEDLYFQGLKYVISKKYESDHLLKTINKNNQSIEELIF